MPIGDIAQNYKFPAYYHLTYMIILVKLCQISLLNPEGQQEWGCRNAAMTTDNGGGRKTCKSPCGPFTTSDEEHGLKK